MVHISHCVGVKEDVDPGPLEFMREDCDDPTGKIQLRSTAKFPLMRRICKLLAKERSVHAASR